MGAPSAAFKAFAEGTAKAWADNLRWKDKIAAGFTNSQNIHGDKPRLVLRDAERPQNGPILERRIL